MKPEDGGEDDLLRELGDLARQRRDEERERLGEAWDRLAAGEASLEEQAELAERAARSPEAAEAMAAFRPLGEDFQDRLVAALREQRDRERAAPVAPPAPPPGQPLPFRPSRRRRALALGAGLAAAAAVAGIVLTRPGPPLPAYGAELDGGAAENRGSQAPAHPTYTPGSAFQLVLRPAIALDGAVEVHCLIARTGTPTAEPRGWPPCEQAERAEGGALRVAGTVGKEIPFEPGEWTLWVIVTRAGLLPPRGLPDDRDLPRLAPGATASGRGWTALHLPEPLRFAA